MGASSIKGITIEIGADTTKLSSAIASANRSIRETEKDLRSVEKALKLDPTSINLWKDKQDLLNTEISETKSKLETLKTAQEQLDAKGVSKNSDEYKALQTEIDTCTASLKSLNEQADAFGSVGAQVVAAWGGKVQEVGDKITEVGTGLSTSVTAPIAAVGAASVAAFTEVDAGLDTIATKTGASGTALEEMQTAAKNLATSIPTDFETAGNAIGEVNTRFGLTGEALEDVSGKFIKFAEINGTDVSTSIDTVQASMAAFGLDASSTGLVLDTLNAAGQATGVSLDTLSQDMTANASTMKELGLSYSDSATFLANLNKNGIDSTSVMGGLKKAYANAAKDGKSLNEALAELETGMEGAATDADATALAIELFGSKSGPAIADAVREGRLSFDELGTSLSDYAGNVDAAFSETQDPIDQMQTAMNEAKLLGADLVESAAPMITAALSSVRDVISDLREKWESLSPGMQDVILKVALVAAAIGPLLVVLGTVVSSVGSIMTMAPAISGALTAITGPIGIVVAAIAGIGAALVTLWNNNEEFRNNITGIWEGLKTSFEEFTGRIKELLENLGIDFSDADSTISEIWQGLCDFLAPVFETVFEGIATFLEGAMDTIAGIIEVATGLISGDWELAWQGIVDTATSIFETVTAPIQGVLDSIKGFFTDKMELVKTTVSDAMDAVKGFFEDKLELIKTTVSGALDAVKGFFTDKMELAKTAVSDAMDAVKGFFTDKFELIKTTVSGAMDSVKGFFTDGISEAKTSVSDTLDDIKKAFTDKLDAAKTAISKIIEKIKKLFDFSLKIDLKVPHISLTGGVAPFGIGGEGSLPKFDVKWYDQGGIFRHPSLIGVGEKRPEFVGALDDLREIVREESGAGASAQLLSQMVTLMGQLVEQGGRPITVNQTINAQQTSYAAQQREAAREFKQIARALA